MFNWSYSFSDTLYLPLHVTPSPLNPLLQAQEKLPIVLVHAALSLQLFVICEHSSMSKRRNNSNINDFSLQIIMISITMTIMLISFTIYVGFNEKKILRYSTESVITRTSKTTSDVGTGCVFIAIVNHLRALVNIYNDGTLRLWVYIIKKHFGNFRWNTHAQFY